MNQNFDFAYNMIGLMALQIMLVIILERISNHLGFKDGFKESILAIVGIVFAILDVMLILDYIVQ